MKRSRLSEEQITFAMRQHDAGTPAEDICRQPSSCHSTMQSANWTFAQRTHRSYGALSASDADRVRGQSSEGIGLKDAGFSGINGSLSGGSARGTFYSKLF